MAHDPYGKEWQSTRERCRTLYVAVTMRLAELYEAREEYAAAIQLVQRLLEHPERNENIFRTLMRLQYLSGDQAAALRTYQACRTYLAEELGVRPLPETRRLLGQILRQEP